MEINARTLRPCRASSHLRVPEGLSAEEEELLKEFVAGPDNAR
jgi:hypothetical protein